MPPATRWRRRSAASTPEPVARSVRRWCSPTSPRSTWPRPIPPRDRDRGVHCFPPASSGRPVLEMTMTSTLDSATTPVSVRARASRPLWTDDDPPADLVPERYRLGDAFVPKSRYLDPEFQQLEVVRLFTKTWLMACRLE